MSHHVITYSTATLLFALVYNANAEAYTADCHDEETSLVQVRTLMNLGSERAEIHPFGSGREPHILGSGDDSLDSRTGRLVSQAVLPLPAAIGELESHYSRLGSSLSNHDNQDDGQPELENQGFDRHEHVGGRPEMETQRFSSHVDLDGHPEVANQRFSGHEDLQERPEMKTPSFSSHDNLEGRAELESKGQPGSFSSQNRLDRQPQLDNQKQPGSFSSHANVEGLPELESQRGSEQVQTPDVADMLAGNAASTVTNSAALGGTATDSMAISDGLGITLSAGDEEAVAREAAKNEALVEHERSKQNAYQAVLEEEKKSYEKYQHDKLDLYTNQTVAKAKWLAEKKDATEAYANSQNSVMKEYLEAQREAASEMMAAKSNVREALMAASNNKH